MQLSHDPAIAFLGIYPREVEKYVHIKTYTQMFIAAIICNSQKLEATQMLFNG